MLSIWQFGIKNLVGGVRTETHINVLKIDRRTNVVFTMPQYYFGIETVQSGRKPDPENDTIITIQYQKIDLRSGKPLREIEILKAWESSEEAIVTQFYDKFFRGGQNKWIFIPVGFDINLTWEYITEKFEQYLGPSYIQPGFHFTIPHIDLLSTVVLLNGGNFIGAKLEKFTNHPPKKGEIKEWFETEDYKRIEDHIKGSAESFLVFYTKVKENMPKILRKEAPAPKPVPTPHVVTKPIPPPAATAPKPVAPPPPPPTPVPAVEALVTESEPTEPEPLAIEETTPEPMTPTELTPEPMTPIELTPKPMAHSIPEEPPIEATVEEEVHEVAEEIPEVDEPSSEVVSVEPEEEVHDVVEEHVEEHFADFAPEAVEVGEVAEEAHEEESMDVHEHEIEVHEVHVEEGVEVVEAEEGEIVEAIEAVEVEAEPVPVKARSPKELKKMLKEEQKRKKKKKNKGFGFGKK